MRKYDFDNLAILEMDRIDLFSSFAEPANLISPLNLSFAAPQPMPLFAEINGTSGDDVLTGTEENDVLE